MRRLVWLGLGVAVGAVVAHQVSRMVREYASESGLAGGLTAARASGSGDVGGARISGTGLLDQVRDFIADVREGMAAREADISEAFERGVSIDELVDDREDGTGLPR